jgi:hypothetical protein
VIGEPAPNATITNTNIINTKCYLFLDRKTWNSYALINPGRYKKIKRKWIDIEGNILDLTNEDYNELAIVEQSELDSLSENTKIIERRFEAALDGTFGFFFCDSMKQ